MSSASSRLSPFAGLAARQNSFLAILVILAGLLLFGVATSRGDLGNFGITMLSGLFQGMLLFLVASGLSIVFGLMDVLNLAQGAFFMIGAYVAYDVQHPGGRIDITNIIPDPNLRFIVAIFGAVVVGSILGVILERGLLRPLYARPVFQLVLTFGVALVMLEVVKAIWSTTPYSWTSIFGILDSKFFLFEQQFGTYRLLVIGLGFLLIISIALLLQRTRIGIIIRAGVEDSAMVEALGINVRSVFTLVFTLGCGVAAFGGSIAAPFLGATVSLGNDYLLKSIAVVVLGGLGSYGGTAIASILVGLASAIMTNLNQPVLVSLTPMLLLLLVLLIRPSGLFGEER
jgi:branched-chain amino acid transport system permease protein